jgi:hypothetical protein
MIRLFESFGKRKYLSIHLCRSVPHAKAFGYFYKRTNPTLAEVIIGEKVMFRGLFVGAGGSSLICRALVL